MSRRLGPPPGGAARKSRWSGPGGGIVGVLRATLVFAVAIWGGLGALPDQAAAGERWLYIGADGGPHAISTYNGLLWAPFNKLGETGPQVRISGTGLIFDYDTHLSRSGGGSMKTNVKAYGYGGNAEAGFQWANETVRLAAFAGAAWRKFKMTPHDPDAEIGGSRIAFSARLDGEWRFAAPYGVMANGNYLTGVDQYWVEVKPFKDLGRGFKIGPSVAYFGGDGYQKMRTGAFFSGYELPMEFSFGRVFVGGGAGVQWDVDHGRATPFGGLHFGVLF